MLALTIKHLRFSRCTQDIMWNVNTFTQCLQTSSQSSASTEITNLSVGCADFQIKDVDYRFIIIINDETVSVLQ